MRFLGIDPGLRLTGYGCVETPPEPARRARHGADAVLIEGGVIRLNARLSISERLAELDADLSGIIERLQPDAIAVEKLYAHYKHPTTAIVMGHARGVVLLNIQRAGIRLIELGATEVKKSLTGNGHASKDQMQRGVQAQLGLPSPPRPPDVADAIAIGLCALRRNT
ncbi:MAG TPA: crossover junction endodeoxyribonuclease RuvC [Phycisphaerales bacterium]|jgi:crossover junction endodeoxyribonuclease RuvC|nr:crossover junction endodeoxyribonuclease RuvC [Phycisphaerales bacterium]